jgi:ferredoxin
MNLLQVAHKYDIELEGACEGVCACSTCHLILGDEIYDQLGGADALSEEEEDMLDMAFGLEVTSRLGCQCLLEKGNKGGDVTLPAATRNFYVDGHVPKPH